MLLKKVINIINTQISITIYTYIKDINNSFLINNSIYYIYCNNSKYI